LLPIYDNPMVYCRLSVLMLSGDPGHPRHLHPMDLPRFQDLLGYEEQWVRSVSSPVSQGKNASMSTEGFIF